MRCRKRYDADAVERYWLDVLEEQLQDAEDDPFADVDALVDMSSTSPSHFENESRESDVKPPSMLALYSVLIAAVALMFFAFSACISAVAFSIAALAVCIVSFVKVKAVKRSTGKRPRLVTCALGTSFLISVIVIAMSTLFVLDIARQEKLTGDVVLGLIVPNESTNEFTEAADADRKEQRDTSSWDSMSFLLNGESFALGETTLSELQERSGWSIDLDEEGYSDGYQVDPHEMISLVPLKNDKAGISAKVYVNVYDDSESKAELSACVVTKISFVSSDVASPNESAFSISGVAIGDSAEDATSAFGEPTTSFDDVDNGGDSYTVCSYSTASYDKSMSFEARQGKTIMAMSMSLN